MKAKITFAVLFHSIICCAAYAQVIHTIAGGIGDGRQATAAPMQPTNVAADRYGNVYIVDQQKSIIRKVSPAGVISTFAGTGTAGYLSTDDNHAAATARLSGPRGVTCDTAGNVYIADAGNARVRKVNTSGIITTFAGGGGMYGNNGVPATSASFYGPVAVAIDPRGNLYIADEGRQWVRKVTPTGLIYTFAGNNSSGFSGDGGAATAARLNSPGSLTCDKYSNLYITDQGNKRVRKVDTNGIITTFAGNGSVGHAGDGGPATAAVLNGIGGLATDSLGNVYIVDGGNNIIRRVNTAGIISRIAGYVTTGGFAGDGGADTAARFNGPVDIATDNSGGYYVADWGNNRIRRVTAAHVTSTLAGNGRSGSQGYSGDGSTAANATLNNPNAVAVDANENIYVADMGNYAVRQITTSGIITTIAGTGYSGYSGDGGPATAAAMGTPYSVATDRRGNIFISDIYMHCIRKISTTGTITTYAGAAGGGFGGDGYSATAALLYSPRCLATDNIGNLYIGDVNNYRIRKVDTNGIINTIAGNGTSGYYGDGGPATSAWISSIGGMAVDDTGNVFITDGNRIRKISTTGIISTIAGVGTVGYSGDGGAATLAQLSYPNGLAVDRWGNLFVHDLGNGYFRKISPSGIITKFAGNHLTGNPSDGSPALSTSVVASPGLAVDSSGNLIVASGTYNTIYEITNCNLNVTANHDTICLGSPVTFSATYTSRATITPSYQWVKNGLNVGTDSSAYTTASLSRGDVVYCRLSNGSSGPLQAISDSVKVAVMSSTPGVYIFLNPNDTVCAGTNVDCTAVPTSGGTAPYYDWFKNSTLVPSFTGATYSFRPVNGDKITCRLHSNMACRLTDTVSATSITFTVRDTATPKVMIVTNPGDSVCAGTYVACTLTTTNAGASPKYTWFLNGNERGANAPNYNFMPVNGDILFCRMTNNGSCLLKDTAYSPSRAFAVRLKEGPSVTISATPGLDIKAGTQATCTATAILGGTAPVYHWYKNSTVVDSGATYTFTPSLLDNVFCMLTSNASCITTSTVYSNQLAFNVDTTSPPPPVIPSGAGVYPNPNHGSFSIKQGIEGPDGMNVNMSVYSVLGKLMDQRVLILKNNAVTTDVSLGRNLPEGVYVVSLAYFTGSKVLYFVVKY